MFRCSVCGAEKPQSKSGGTGYAEYPDGRRVCYECCAVLDRQEMVASGHGNRLPLYLTKKDDGSWSVSNWPGTLRFACSKPKVGRHNIAGRRYDVWFNGPDGHRWHGVQYGEWTEIVHCSRTREVVR